MSVDFRKLVKAGVHFGHQTSRWSPKMAPYIWGHKNKVHLIDVSKTANQLEQATKFLESVAAEGKQILWVGTKKAAQKVIQQVASELDMPYVNHRWIGGTLSNHAQVKKAVTKYLHLKDVIERSGKATHSHYTKKEINTFQKQVERLEKTIGGIINLKWPIGAIVIVDASKERSAIEEAKVMGIPVVGIVDTNSDPSLVDYVIPGNDDAPPAIQILIDALKEATVKGKQDAEKKVKEAKTAKAAKKPEVKATEKTEAKTLRQAQGERGKAKVEKKKAAPKAAAKEKTATKDKPAAKTSAKTKTKTKKEDK